MPTSVWSKKSPVDINQIYTRLSRVKEEQTPAGSSQSEFSKPKTILVYGRSGIGKTTFFETLAVDWAKRRGVGTESKLKDVLSHILGGNILNRAKYNFK